MKKWIYKKQLKIYANLAKSQNRLLAENIKQNMKWDLSKLQILDIILTHNGGEVRYDLCILLNRFVNHLTSILSHRN